MMTALTLFCTIIAWIAAIALFWARKEIKEADERVLELSQMIQGLRIELLEARVAEIKASTAELHARLDRCYAELETMRFMFMCAKLEIENVSLHHQNAQLRMLVGIILEHSRYERLPEAHHTIIDEDGNILID